MKGILTFMFSFIPGAGQMHLGYMKRGLSIMSIAGLIFMLALEFGSIFLIPFLIIMAYSFFDTYNIRNMIRENGNDKKEDEFIWNGNDIIDAKFADTKFKNKSLGWILIILGSWCIFDKIGYSVIEYIDSDVLEHIYYTISRRGPSVIIAGFAMYFGLKMIKE